MRRWLPWTAIAAVTLAIGWLAFVALAPDAVYSGDFGVKFVQARELWNNHFASLAIAPRNTFLDPDGRFSPLKAPFVFATRSGVQAIFPPAASILQALFVPLNGLLGMRLLSLLSVTLASWVTWRLSPRGWAGATMPLVLALATPLWFYGVIESEHAPAIALAALSFLVALSGEGHDPRRALAAGLILGAAASIRDESILLVPGLVLACWSRGHEWRTAAWAVGGCVAMLALAAAVEVLWFGRPMAAHLRHAVHILRVALRMTNRPNEELPELEPLTLGQRWDYVGQYWVFGVGSDALIIGLAALVAASVAARAWSRNAWALLPALATLIVVASLDLFYLLREPKWVPGLYRLTPFLVFAVIPPPDDVRNRWLWRVSLFSVTSYVILAFAGVDTSGGKSLGPRLLLPLLPLLVAASWRNVADFVASPRLNERVAGLCGIALTVLAFAIHLGATIPAYVVRSNEDASAMRTIRSSSERVIVADDMYTAQQILPMYYNRVILLAETPPAGHEIGLALEQQRIAGAIMVSRNPDLPTGLPPLRLVETVQRGRFYIQYWRR